MSVKRLREKAGIEARAAEAWLDGAWSWSDGIFGFRAVARLYGLLAVATLLLSPVLVGWVGVRMLHEESGRWMVPFLGTAALHLLLWASVIWTLLVGLMVAIRVLVTGWTVRRAVQELWFGVVQSVGFLDAVGKTCAAVVVLTFGVGFGWSRAGTDGGTPHADMVAVQLGLGLVALTGATCYASLVQAHRLLQGAPTSIRWMLVGIATFVVNDFVLHQVAPPRVVATSMLEDWLPNESSQMRELLVAEMPLLSSVSALALLVLLVAAVHLVAPWRQAFRVACAASPDAGRTSAATVGEEPT
ncbi:hypothetical protein [Pimelobacter simplex]|uniref:hypothetical protein n=1 Tax=Nocardioides simplex TaxID=2045 RepID=UPI00214FE9B2|nr:hypothetical protein [Pimelobacter simplex]UUW90580.1 hypothetical protein M0M43_03560 [Pimelobacter simplex]UUW94411.1 hypothetical protein M0M48_22080 [Pimelobacter simplex]